MGFGAPAAAAAAAAAVAPSAATPDSSLATLEPLPEAPPPAAAPSDLDRCAEFLAQLGIAPGDPPREAARQHAAGNLKFVRALDRLSALDETSEAAEGRMAKAMRAAARAEAATLESSGAEDLDGLENKAASWALFMGGDPQPGLERLAEARSEARARLDAAEASLRELQLDRLHEDD